MEGNLYWGHGNVLGCFLLGEVIKRLSWIRSLTNLEGEMVSIVEGQKSVVINQRPRIGNLYSNRLTKYVDKTECISSV